MKFSSTTVSILATATAVVGSRNLSNIGNFAKAALRSSSHFGIVSRTSISHSVFGVIPRGGASEEDQGKSETDNTNVPATLYLPGLVDAKVAKKNVSFFI